MYGNGYRGFSFFRHRCKEIDCPTHQIVLRTAGFRDWASVERPVSETYYPSDTRYYNTLSVGQLLTKTCCPSDSYSLISDVLLEIKLLLFLSLSRIITKNII